MAQILVVDDDPSVRSTVEDVLKAAGHDVDSAANAAAAKAGIEDHEYPVVIADMRMELPTSGLDVLRCALEKDPLCQVIVLTAYNSVDDAVKSMEGGAFTYLAKRGETQEYTILLGQVQRALAYRDSLQYAPSAITRGLDAACRKLAEAVSQIQESMAQLDAVAAARNRLLGHLQREGRKRGTQP